ncbi:MAG: hypothetical protein ACI4U3_10980 [Traorella sp.]
MHDFDISSETFAKIYAKYKSGWHASISNPYELGKMRVNIE